MTPDQFFAINNDKLVNNGGTQCVAVANQYNRDVVRGGWIGTPLTGYAIDWWTNFGNDADFNNYVRIDKGATPQKGDVAIWTKYPSSGLPHIAIVRKQVNANTINCFTQNPGKAHFEDLTKTGLAGYLRPKKFVVAMPAPTPTPAPAKKAVTEDVVLAVIRGDYGNDPQRSTNLRNAGYDPVVVQNLVNARKAAPAPQPAPAPAPVAPLFAVGDRVVPTKAVSYDGAALIQFDPNYVITELNGKRAVLTARGAVWAAVSTDNLRKA